MLLSQAHRLRALVLLGKFLDLGPWAVNLVRNNKNRNIVVKPQTDSCLFDMYYMYLLGFECGYIPLCSQVIAISRS